MDYIADYMIDKKEEIKELEVVDRDIELKPNNEFAVSLIGPRRAGKTFTIYNLIKKLNIRDDDYIFINFEDDVIAQSRDDIRQIVQKHVELYGRRPQYLFFDEIQSMDKWESFVYSFIEKKKYKIVLTGSSSRLLSREIATSLRGRTVNRVVFPFSFKEYLKTNKFEFKKLYSSIERAKIKNMLRDYLNKGGFPQVVLNRISRNEFVREYLNVVLYKDIVERFRIKNIDVAKFLLISSAQSFAKEFSVNKLYNQLKNRVEVSNKTLYEYMSYLNEVFFVFLLYRFSYSTKKSLLTIPKLYINDTGLSLSNEIGRKMENTVFIELKKKELNNIHEIFYFKDYQQREVDFVIKERNRVKELIQVTYASSKDEIERRELRALKKASELFKCKNMKVITWDYEDVSEGIEFIPLWKWLLAND